MAGTCNPSYSGGWGGRITWTWEAEVAVSRDHSTALQPGQQDWNAISNKQKKRTLKRNFWNQLLRKARGKPECWWFSSLNNGVEADREDLLEAIYTVTHCAEKHLPFKRPPGLPDSHCSLSGRPFSKLTFLFQEAAPPLPLPSSSELPGISFHKVENKIHNGKFLYFIMMSLIKIFC